MQESWTFDFSLTTYPKVDLEQLLSQKERELGIFLSYYYKKEGAVAEKVLLKSGPEFESKNTGFMTLDFDLVHFNACLAIHEQVREEMKISFEIDEENQKVVLTGPYWPERGLDEI
ncbi:hypothetical protein [Algoriphagus boritolerans]|uniref:Uncharacterized protein n=1 Tax=Algoriphagus boritolerans DSM 17298 = JCM 18970 TaxID=1120964 RepID=A0A1H5XL36_9BACT|nr:hypothetical protein [Algoriphagus boritolerans]SEG12432.1 hypothetical protein SAMN03080598_02556 [Algoriphagus boritolerans DSM 17298 = JCM 18970]